MQAGPSAPSPRGSPWGSLLQRHRRRLLRWRERVRLSEDAFHLILAGGVGVIGGFVSLGLSRATHLASWLIFREEGAWTDLAAAASPWLRLLLPAVGAFLAGWILHWSARVARLPDPGNYLEVVLVGDGRLNLRSALAKALASLISFSSGGSIGREGLIVHLSAAFASRSGQWAHWPPYRLRLLVACGAAAGMSAAYNAPVAGAVFAAQIVLGSFSMSLFAPLVFASVVATVVSRTFFAIPPVYDVPTDFAFTRLTQLPWFIVLGLVAGLVGAGFLRSLRWTSVWFETRIPALPWRMAAGGALVGLLAVPLPAICGNGYEPANHILLNDYALRMMAFLLIGKLVATLATVGSGAVGGVFTPTLFLGAAVGGVLGDGLHALRMAEDLSPAAFALVGMGSMLAATTHSPLLAVIMIFEISLNTTLMMPLMVACTFATLAARCFHEDDIYTAPLRRRGLLLERDSPRLGVATQKTVGDLMQAPVPPVHPQTPFRELVDRFLASPVNFLPVVNASQRLLGLVALEDLKLHLGSAADLDTVIAYDVMRPPPPCLTPTQRVLDAVPLLLASEQRNVPVVSTLAEMKLVGVVYRPEALGLLSEVLESRPASPGRNR